jgi:hypothetical protein
MTGRIEGPMPPPPGGASQPEKKGSFWETILRLIGLSPSKSTSEVQRGAQIPPSQTSSWSDGGVPKEEAIEGAKLAEMAMTLAKTPGARLTESRGRLEVKGRPLFFANLRSYTNKSPENAKRFLALLATQVAKDKNLAAAKAIFQDFAASDWVKTALFMYSDVQKQFVRTALAVYGLPFKIEDFTKWMEESPDTARVAFRNFVSSDLFKNESLSCPEFARSVVEMATAIFGPPSLSNYSDWMLIEERFGWGSVETVLQDSKVPGSQVADAGAEPFPKSFLSFPGKEIAIRVGERSYVLKKDQEGGRQLFTLSLVEEGRETLKSKIKVDPTSGQCLGIEDSEGHPLRSFPPSLVVCLEMAAKKLDTMKDVQSRLVQAGVPGLDAERLSIQWMSQWRGDFVEGSDTGKGILEPTRVMKGLKIGGKEGDRYGDYSFTKLGSGAEKKAKKMVRITAEGDVETGVRYGKVDKGKKEGYLRSMEREWAVRQGLLKAGKELPLPSELDNHYLFDHILKVEKYVSHGGASGEVTRYVAEEGAGDLFKRIYREVKDYYELLPEEQRAAARPLLVHACLGALRGLRHLHVRGFVNKDVKPDNVLLIDGEGKLADFGLTTHESEDAVPCGTEGRIAPELIQKHYHGEVDVKEDPKTDMFSFGVMLLEAWDGGLGDELVGSLVEAASSYLDYCDAINRMRQKLYTEIMSLRAQGKPTQPLELIIQLINPDPSTRPSSTDAEKVLQRVEESLRQQVRL